jgi:OOP family OmpA-OmpF porin
MNRAGLALFLVLSGPAHALDLTLPATARQTVERNTAPDRYAAPSGVYRQGEVPMLTVEGDVRRAAWRLGSPGLTPLQVMRPLRAQLIEAGYEIVLDCDSNACGGFDFRFAIETLPGPNMYVNIRAFHFVTAARFDGDVPQEVMTVLTSTSATSAYVQIIQAGSSAGEAVAVKASADLPITTQPVAESDIGAQLLRAGHVVLRELDFDSGTTDLGQGPFKSLAELASFLTAQTDLRVALVGHTDTVGSLDANITVSRRRAQSVRQHLIEKYGIAGNRLDAEGMGYLAPIASNLDAEGRDANRRVEAILLKGP